jgi:6-phosphogluconolactonase (cycloisomerase 2 family)
MLIASQCGDRVGVYAIDPATGMARETDSSIVVNQPVCVKFAPAE